MEAKKEKVEKVVKVLSTEEQQALQKERLVLAGITMTEDQLKAYYKQPDDLGEYKANMEIPMGYKKCGKCQHVLKFYRFNKNSGSKTCTTGNCKVCQVATASKSYGQTKKKRNYKKYYQEHKEMKQEVAKRYYQENREDMTLKHKEYLNTHKGKKVMKAAHTKRSKAINKNKGIPYTRMMLIDRDSTFIQEEQVTCLLCGNIIENPKDGNSCHIDHIIGVVNGGLDCLTNVHLTHRLCNLVRTKDQRDLEYDLVTKIKSRSEAYIDAHADQFERKDATVEI